MKTKKKTGPPAFKKADKRILAGVMLSPNEQARIAKVRGEIPFSIWARNILLRGLTEDPTPISDKKVKPKK